MEGEEHETSRKEINVNGNIRARICLDFEHAANSLQHLLRRIGNGCGAEIEAEVWKI
jgi:hypothetical protein